MYSHRQGEVFLLQQTIDYEKLGLRIKSIIRNLENRKSK